jgi:hypothetical protein
MSISESTCPAKALKNRPNPDGQAYEVNATARERCWGGAREMTGDRVSAQF